MTPQRKKIILTILGGVFLYLASAGVSFAAFRFLGQAGTSGLLSPVSMEEARSRIDLSAPKTEICPINGQLFTKAEKEIWENHRPIAVMIENHADSRPQSGLSKADVVYEAVAEGGITRFLGIFYCGASAEDVKLAPVRSARVYYIDWASEYGDYPIYVHVGGANDYSGSGDTAREAKALEKLETIGWRYRGGNDFDTTLDGQYPVFWRDYERLGRPAATEHTMCSSTDKIWDEAQARGFNAVDDEGNQWDENFEPWEFKDEASEAERGEIGEIEFNFWDGYKQYLVNWQYHLGSNVYLRSTGGSPDSDHNNDQRIEARVVIVQFAKETGPVDRNKHLLYTTTGKGSALVFQDGEVESATWSKKDRQSRTRFTDLKGQEIELNPGSIWIEIVPAGKDVEY